MTYPFLMMLLHLLKSTSSCCRVSWRRGVGGSSRLLSRVRASASDASLMYPPFKHNGKFVGLETIGDYAIIPFFWFFNSLTLLWCLVLDQDYLQCSLYDKLSISLSLLFERRDEFTPQLFSYRDKIM
jgi:hypothetical protein